METKLTYENMKKLCDDYFYGFEEASKSATAEQKVAMIAQYFSKSCITRFRDSAAYEYQEVWTDTLANNHPTHVYEITIDEPHGYTVIDPETGFLCVAMKEDVVDSETGEVVRSIQNSPHFHCIIEDGKVKFDRELITRFPGYFQIDYLVTDPPRTTVNWLFRDYSHELKGTNGMKGVEGKDKPDA